MKEKIEKFIKETDKNRNRLVRLLKEWVNDETIPLEERWELFIYSKLGDTGGYIEHFDSLKAIKGKPKETYGGKTYIPNFEDYYLTSYVEKYQTVEVDTILEWLIDYREDEYDEDKQFDIKDENINAFKREVLKKFVYSFTFDW